MYKVALAVSLAILGLAVPGFASNLTIDLTGTGTATLLGGTAAGTILDATSAPTSVGTGNIDSFVRLQANGSETGYNTDATPPPDDDKAGSFTHSILVSSLDTTSKPGYYTFLLDINQTSSKPLLSLDDIQLYTASSGSISSSGTPAGATKIYDLQTATSCSSVTVSATCATPSSNGRTEILLDYANNSGSGNGFDMFLYVPAAVFSGVSPSSYLYLYSQFGLLGGNYATNDGFEEWAKVSGTPTVPEPMFVGIPLAALASLGLLLRRRAQAKSRDQLG